MCNHGLKHTTIRCGKFPITSIIILDMAVVYYLTS